MSLHFHDASHASMRLSHSIVQYKGEPVYLSEVRSSYSVDYYLMKNQKEGRIEDVRDNKDLDVKPVPLGFCQVGSRARYLMRSPRRRYKQGLNEESLTANGGNLPSITNSIFMTALSKTIKGEYPTLAEVLQRIGKGGVESMAFHRNWAALAREEATYLLFKYHGSVGKIIDGIPVLDANWTYLQETLDDEINRA